MLAFAWLTGREFGFPFLAWGGFSVRNVLATIAAFAGLLVLRVLVRRSRTDAERRELAVFRFAPRTAAEWRATVLMIGVTAVSEEVAYRGVAHAVLWWTFGNGYLAAGLAAAGFAGAHAVQGRKSMTMIFVTALVMHALVAGTGTLFLAMAVHAAFDLYAGWRIAVEARTLLPQET
ncbi:MAG: CPBP family intramembrane metalloprotease [Gemmatimonadetes bacterium]|nr:CPBP family intramembrane metalloprotease [Gemmatimonadota bacterium]